MSGYVVKDLTVPLSEYATVRVGSTLLDAVLALEKAQLAFDHTKYTHRAVLILDKNDRVVGKLGQLDVLRALEPHNPELEAKLANLESFGFSSAFIRKLQQENRIMGKSLSDLCAQAVNLKVESFMQTPSEGEFVDQNVSLKAAIFQLLSGHHFALLVTDKEEIVGILRLSDVFAAIFHTMKKEFDNN